MASITYENTKTGQTATYAQPMPKLEKSDNWKRVERGKKPATKKTDDDGKS